MALTTIEEVQFEGQLSSEYSEDEILSEMDVTSNLLYNDYKLPRRSSFTTNDDYTKFYISDDTVHEIIRLRVSVESDVDPSGYLEIDSSTTTWTFIPKTNYVTLAAAFLATYQNKSIRVDYNPKIFNLLAKSSTAYNLTNTTNIVNGEVVQPPLVQRLGAKITRYKKSLKPIRKITKSSTNEVFDRYEYVSFSQSDLR